MDEGNYPIFSRKKKKKGKCLTLAQEVLTAKNENKENNPLRAGNSNTPLVT
jgi:hypothetical protein